MWQPFDAREPSARAVRITPRMLIRSMRTLSLASLFLVTAVVAGCAAVISQNWQVGIVLSFIALVALCRTTLFSLYHKVHQIPLGIPQKTGAYIISLLFVSVALAACQVAFVAVCFPIGVMSGSLDLAVFSGLAVALVCFFLVMWFVPVY
ncbi:MAG: hypothetical protein AAF483_25260 [Planctomycetota bacterium]